MERMASGKEDYELMHRRVQEALRAIGAVEQAIGDLGGDEMMRRTREELNQAVVSMQEVRDWLSARQTG